MTPQKEITPSDLSNQHRSFCGDLPRIGGLPLADRKAAEASAQTSLSAVFENEVGLPHSGREKVADEGSKSQKGQCVYTGKASEMLAKDNP